MTVPVSIIICTSNRATDLVHTLESISRLDIPQVMQAEVVIVDNASTDNTAEVVRNCNLKIPVQYLYEAKRGKGNAYNTGIASAHGEIFLFTDDDVRLPHNWIEGMCAPILAGKAQAVAGGVKIAPHLDRPWMSVKHRAALASTDYIDENSPTELVGANMAFSRRVLDQVPAFDTELGPGALGFSEDTLFAKQLIKAGYTLVSAFDMIAVHHLDESRLLRASYLARSQKQGRSSAYIYYHWHHRTISRPYLDLLRYQLLLRYSRIKRRQELTLEGCPEWEMALVEAISFRKQYLVERKRPYNYQQYGLVKISSG